MACSKVNFFQDIHEVKRNLLYSFRTLSFSQSWLIRETALQTRQMFNFIRTMWQVKGLQCTSTLIITREERSKVNLQASWSNDDERWKARRPLKWVDEWYYNNVTYLDNTARLVATWHTGRARQ
jgi:hypothetical protein